MNWNGKKKAVTFSYDDGVTQDERLVALFDQYGVKCTFNINSGLLGQDGFLMIEGKRISHRKIQPEQVRDLYAGHEVAVHTLTHPRLPDLDAAGDTAEVIRQVEQDRLALSALCGYEVVGMAYPCGGVNNTEHVADIIKANTGVQYARTITSTHTFALPENLYRLDPSVYHRDMETMLQMADAFLALEPEEPALFYIWGHSYEFDVQDSWDSFEKFLGKISGKEDIFYGTNKEVLL